MTVRTYRIADIVCRVEMEQGQEIAMFRGFEDTSGEEPTIRVRMYQKSGIFRQAGTVPGQKEIGTVLFLCLKSLPNGRK